MVNINLLDLNESDSQFFQDLVSMRDFNLESRKDLNLSGKIAIFEGFYEFLEYKELDGYIRKLGMNSWFLNLLPFWIRKIVGKKRSHGLSKNIITAINEYILNEYALNLNTPPEIDPNGDPVDDLPTWYLNVVPESIGHLPNLESLNLAQNHLITLPESMKNLGTLMELNLSYNMFKNLPNWLAELPKLQQLNVSHNPLQAVPKCVVILAEKCYARFHAEVPHEEAVVLGILEILSGKRLYKIDDNYFDSDNAHYYRINSEGHVSHIYIRQEDILFEFFPEQICELFHLEELHIIPNAITKLPESLVKLKKLRVLDLYREYVDVGRAEEHIIPESIFPFLKNLEDFIYQGEVLEKLGL